MRCVAAAKRGRLAAGGGGGGGGGDDDDDDDDVSNGSGTCSGTCSGGGGGNGGDCGGGGDVGGGDTTGGDAGIDEGDTSSWNERDSMTSSGGLKKAIRLISLGERKQIKKKKNDNKNCHLCYVSIRIGKMSKT